MRLDKNFWTGVLASLGLIILILDAKTAIAGAQEGLTLCIKCILPTLFPFCFLTKLIHGAVVGRPIPFLRPIGKACGIPKGAESLLLLGFLGGYPVGAQGINDAVKTKSLSSEDAGRMLGFCNNAGPAFLFGMLGGLFTNITPLWCLLLIHITSAILVGCILPGKTDTICRLQNDTRKTLPVILEESVKTMALVCGWIILFRMLLHFCQRWFLWICPATVQVIIAGLLELSNGCVLLYDIPTEGLRYILSAGMLSFGGVCVALQTMSVAKNIPESQYFPGKILQTSISLIMAWLSQYLLFPAEQWGLVSLWLPVFCTVVIAASLFVLYAKKKVVAFVG